MHSIPYLIDERNISPIINLARVHHSESQLEISWRTIPDFEFVFFHDGSGRYQILDQIIEYSRGDLLLVPPWVRHRYQSMGNRSRHCAIHFSWSPGFEEQFESNKLLTKGASQIAMKLGDQPLPLITRGFPLQHISLFEKLDRLQHDPDIMSIANQELRLKQHMLHFICEWLDFLRQQRVGNRGAFSISLAFIQRNFTRHITIPDLARTEGLSPNHFTTAFKNTFGVSPLTYITTMRIDWAKKLLHETDHKIRHVAEQCGYDDQYYFSRAFKRVVGISPAHYRRQIV